MADAFVQEVLKQWPGWAQFRGIHTFLNGKQAEAFKLPCPNPNIDHPLILCCQIADTADEISIGWVDGHHEHLFFNGPEGVPKAVANALWKIDNVWMNPNVIWCTRIRDGQFVGQWTEMHGHEREEPLAMRLFLDEDSQKSVVQDTVRKYSWTGEFDATTPVP